MLKYDIYLNDIREMIKRIEKQLKKRKLNFKKDVDNYDMLVLRLQIIGQSVNELPKEITSKFPEVNWKIFVTFRNISSHNYSAINKGIFTRILKKELPLLKNAMLKLK